MFSNNWQCWTRAEFSYNCQVSKFIYLGVKIIFFGFLVATCDPRKRPSTNILRYGVIVFPPISWQSLKEERQSVQYRTLGDCSYGHNGIQLATAAGDRGAITTRGGSAKDARLASVCRYHKVRDGTRPGGLPAQRLLEPESESIPWEEFLHNSVRRCAGESWTLAAAAMDGRKHSPGYSGCARAIPIVLCRSFVSYFYLVIYF